MISNGVIHRSVSVPDLQKALSTSVSDTGLLCMHANINPMARYKPLRNTKVAPLTESEKSALRYGFSTITPSFGTDNPDNKAVWEYLKPRANTTDRFRFSDFIKGETSDDGYDMYACAPFAFGVEGPSIDSREVEGNGGVGFPIYINSGVNAYYSGSPMRWTEGCCLTLSELLSNYSGNAYIGFAIFDLSDNAHRVVVSNKKITQLSSYVPTIILTSVTKTLSDGLTYPGVDLFSDERRAGHTFRFIAFLYNNFPGGDGYTTTYAYRLLDNNVDVNSLAFMDGIDRHDCVVPLHNTISGLECSLITGYVTLSFVGTETIGSYSYNKYRCDGTVYGNFKTPGDWSNAGVRVKVTIRSNSGYPNSVTSPSNFTSEKYISLPHWSTSYTFQALTNAFSFYVWFISYVSVSERTVIVSAVACGEADIESERITFGNSFDVKATS